ncbi:MAG TPA: GntR family transcriptional regulator [Chloroflexota bacterium]|jgi:DNA-binding GntR family transcriptional regulator
MSHVINADATPSTRRRATAESGSKLIAQPLNMRQQVHSQIKAMLISGELAPGELCSVYQLAEVFGVSRTPVREALLQLAREGLLRAERNRGFRVVVSSPLDLDNISEIRMLLEVPAMVKVAKLQPRPTEQFERSRIIYERMATAARAGNLRRFIQADTEFHIHLVSLTGNQRLTALVSDLRDHMHLPGLQKLAQSGGLEQSSDEHLHLLEALERGDSNAAADIARAHIGRTRAEWA